LKTVKYFLKKGYEKEKIHVVIDSEADDFDEYQSFCEKKGVNLHVFDMTEARERYDYVHRASISRRSAGQARNMIYDIAASLGVYFYVVQDDDTSLYQVKYHGRYIRTASIDDINTVFIAIKEFMQRQRIGLFGLSQTGDIIGGDNKKLLRWKVMNTTFVNMKYIYRGERGVQDDDASMFVGVYNEGLFTGSLGDGLVLSQTPSATAKGGLTDLYNECKLLNKALLCPIQFPSAIKAERQEKNGNRVHHKIISRNLIPKLIRNEGGRSNIAWDTYVDDGIFTNEPKR
jgi:hypothetical protein